MRHRLPVPVLVLAALAFAAIGVALGVVWHDARQDASDAERLAAAIDARGEVATEVDEALAFSGAVDSVISVQEPGDDREFADVARQALAEPHVLGVGWAPRVSGDGEVTYPVSLEASRDSFELAGRDLAGVPGFRSAIDSAELDGDARLAEPVSGEPLYFVRQAERVVSGADRREGALVVALDPALLAADVGLGPEIEIRDDATVLIDGEDAGESGAVPLQVGGREWFVAASTDPPSFLLPGLLIGLAAALAILVVALALAGAARERRLRERADRNASRAEALRALAEVVSDTEAGEGDRVPFFAASAARAASEASAAGVVRFAGGPSELARVGAPGDDEAAISDLVDRVHASGEEESSLAAGGMLVVTPVRTDDDMWGVIWVSGAPQDAADPAAAAHVLGVGLANLHRRAELRVQARTDALTGLANRRSFMDQLRREFALARRQGRRLSAAMIDIDHFKAVNDEHGHPAGDQTLAELAQRLVGVARASDLVGRVGGEEFAWLMPETSLAEAWLAAERARLAVAAEPMPGDVGLVTISIGVADISSVTRADDLYAHADGALYAAKTSGRDLVSLHPAEVEPVGTEDEVRDRGVARARSADAAAEIARHLGWDPERVESVVAAASGEDSDAAGGADWIGFRVARWDGGPRGEHPRGEEIPVEARVLAVADAWVALVGEGGDEAAVRAQALAALQAASGRAFWPDAVDALAQTIASEPACT